MERPVKDFILRRTSKRVTKTVHKLQTSSVVRFLWWTFCTTTSRWVKSKSGMQSASPQDWAVEDVETRLEAHVQIRGRGDTEPQVEHSSLILEFHDLVPLIHWQQMTDWPQRSMCLHIIGIIQGRVRHPERNELMVRQVAGSREGVMRTMTCCWRPRTNTVTRVPDTCGRGTWGRTVPRAHKVGRGIHYTICTDTLWLTMDPVSRSPTPLE